MKREKIQDERIIFQKQKIGSDAFGIVFFGLLISVLLQQFELKATFSNMLRNSSSLLWLQFIL